MTVNSKDAATLKIANQNGNAQKLKTDWLGLSELKLIQTHNNNAFGFQSILPHVNECNVPEV